MQCTYVLSSCCSVASMNLYRPFLDDKIEYMQLIGGLNTTIVGPEVSLKIFLSNALISSIHLKIDASTNSPFAGLKNFPATPQQQHFLTDPLSTTFVSNNILYKIHSKNAICNMVLRYVYEAILSFKTFKNWPTCASTIRNYHYNSFSAGCSTNINIIFRFFASTI